MPHQNRIVALRKQWRLTQDELALLLGLTRTAISKLEVNGGGCKIETAFTLEMLFNVPAVEVFPELYSALYESLVPRLAHFSVNVNGSDDEDASAKRLLLSEFAARAKATNGAGA